MGPFIKGLLGLILVAYPFLVYFAIQKQALGLLTLFLITVAILRLFLANKLSTAQLNIARQSALLLIVLAVMSYWLKDSQWFMVYPVIMSFIMLLFFGQSLFQDKSMIQRFAELRETGINAKKQNYMRKLTLVWCGFFVVNGLIAFYTWQFTSLEIWTLYNGFISYVLMGLLIAGELVFRRFFIIQS